MKTHPCHPLLIICILFNIFFSFTAHADVISDTLKGKEFLFQRNYPAAIKLFEQIELDYLDSPSGTFGQMASYQMMMFENLDFRFRKEYGETEKRFEKVVSKMLKGKPASWDLFVSGAGYGMRGFYYAREDKWFRALGSALRAVQLLKRAAYEDPSFIIDASLGIGMYNYWRSVMTKGLNFLPFFGDRRREGIRQIEKVANEGKHARDLSLANLAFIYAQEKTYSKSRKIVDNFLQDYPKNIVLRQLSARLYFITKSYDDSI